jgi:hypothetical protein
MGIEKGLDGKVHQLSCGRVYISKREAMQLQLQRVRIVVLVGCVSRRRRTILHRRAHLRASTRRPIFVRAVDSTGLYGAKILVPGCPCGHVDLLSNIQLRSAQSEFSRDDRMIQESGHLRHVSAAWHLTTRWYY